MNKLAVVALGGNALLRGNQIGTIDEQEQNTTRTMENLIRLIEAGYNLVISHGNGPQVGNILMQKDAGEQIYGIPQMPLDVCVAESQGSIGYMIERALRNALLRRGINRQVCCLVTPVVVNPDDPAFQNPTKRVGRLYNQSQADELAKAKGWVFKHEVKDSGSGWRRVVPSPKPIGILNHEIVKMLAHQGVIVIASGGGGIPVYMDEDGQVRPSEAVIDKDSASALLASFVGANEFYILTDVPFVYLNYKKADEQKLERLNRADAERLLTEGVFGEGNMLPKVSACLQFIDQGGCLSIITEATKLSDPHCGTKFTLEYED